MRNGSCIWAFSLFDNWFYKRRLPYSLNAFFCRSPMSTLRSWKSFLHKRNRQVNFRRFGVCAVHLRKRLCNFDLTYSVWFWANSCGFTYDSIRLYVLRCITRLRVKVGNKHKRFQSWTVKALQIGLGADRTISSAPLSVYPVISIVHKQQEKNIREARERKWH